MKKLICLALCILCSSFYLCGCQPPDKGDVMMEQYLLLSLPETDFAKGAEVTVAASIGFTETFISGCNDKTRAILTVSPDEKLNFTDKNYYVLKTITDFHSFVLKKNGAEITHTFTEKYTVPQDIFQKDSGFFYCSLYLLSVETDDYEQKNVTMSLQYCISYVSDENGITLKIE